MFEYHNKWADLELRLCNKGSVAPRKKSWRGCEASEHVTLYTFLCYVTSKFKQVKRL